MNARHALLRAVLLAAMGLLAAAAGAAELRPFDAGSLAELRARYAGKPFVLAFWSATCAPCREELPHWSDWQHRFPTVPLVLVATDGPEDHAAVRALLAGATGDGIDTRAFASDFAEPIRHAVDRRWYGEVPRTYFFAADHRSEASSGRLDPARVEAWLKAQSPARAR